MSRFIFNTHYTYLGLLAFYETKGDMYILNYYYMIKMQVISVGWNNDKPFITIDNPKLIPRVGEIISYHPYDWDDDHTIDAVTINSIDYLYKEDGSVTVTIWI